MPTGAPDTHAALGEASPVNDAMTPRHVFLVLAHERPGQLAALIAKLKHPAVQCIVHLDIKTRDRFPPLEASVIASRDITWGGAEMVEAELDLLRQARRDGPFRTYTLLSGVDWPLYPIDALVHELDQLDASALDAWDDPDSHWHQRYRRRFFHGHPQARLLNALSRRLSRWLPDRHPPADVWFGSQWWTLLDDAAESVLTYFDDRPDVRAWLRTIHIPDECAIQTAVMNSRPRPASTRRTRRYLDWSEKQAHPRVLAHEELAALDTDAWFARKVHTRDDID